MHTQIGTHTHIHSGLFNKIFDYGKTLVHYQTFHLLIIFVGCRYVRITNCVRTQTNRYLTHQIVKT